jgi:hypothetical protein
MVTINERLGFVPVEVVPMFRLKLTHPDADKP